MNPVALNMAMHGSTASSVTSSRNDRDPSHDISGSFGNSHSRRSSGGDSIGSSESFSTMLSVMTSSSYAPMLTEVYDMLMD